MHVSSYIDPGTGSVIAGSLWGVISSILIGVLAFLMAYFIRPLKRLLGKAWKAIRNAGWLGAGLAVIIIVISSVIINYQTVELGMKEKVIVLGIDAMDPVIVERMMEEGRLPNLKRLGDSGGYSRLGTTTPPETPVAWSAAATGSNPGGYGIFDFIERSKENYLPSLSITEENTTMAGTQYTSPIKGTPFWRITSSNGIPTSVIKWPVTFPAEKVNGRMLSGLGTVDIKGLLNSYSFYTMDDVETGPMDAGKIVKVARDGNEINTVLYGPRVREGGNVRESEVPMRIILGDRPVIELQGNSYEVGEDGWSSWIRAVFSTGFMSGVHGIFKAYIPREGEFSMYVTSVQIDPENQAYDITYPKSYGKELSNDIGLFYTMGQPEDTKAVNEGRISREVFLEQFREIEKEREDIFWHEFNRFSGGVLAFGFDSGDRMQHIFWGDNETIEDYYIQKDGLVGEILEKIDGDTSLMIFSDHGFNSFKRSVCINTWLVENGYMTLVQEPAADDPGTLFRYVDWGRTKAYSLGFASIFINLKGRESHGIVEEAEKDVLIDEIIQGLSKLRDTKTGKKPILNMYKGNEIYSGDFAGDAPDMIIGFDEGYRMSWENAIGGVRKNIIEDNNEEWRGDHLIDPSRVPGVLFTNFNITKEKPSLMDIAPTVLGLFGLDIPESMDGESLVGE
jgi:predicted AlkP superfamily phosphohydrolase/phosphomutase